MIQLLLFNLAFIFLLMSPDMDMNNSSAPITKSYSSQKYGYSINIPEGFRKTKANRKTIDLKLANNTGESIIVNVTPRTEQEYSITAHDYTSELLESAIQPHKPNFKIIKSEYIYIDGYKAFRIYYTYSKKGLKAIECYVYHKDEAFVLTATARISNFTKFESIYLSTINSLKFEK